ncbi:unnamed protein product [Cuscuta europaea]|nr:unnamed protein product [Cuscuta europaea]
MDQIFATSAQGNLKYTPGNIISEEDLHVDVDDVYTPSLPTDIHHDMGAGEEENNEGGNCTTNASWDDLWSELTPTSLSPSEHIPQSSQIERDERRKGKRPLEGDSSQSSKSGKTNQTKKTGMAAFQEMFGGMMEVVSKRGESINEITNLMKDMIKANSSKNTSEYSLGEAMAKLCCLDGLSTTSPEFFFGCSMFEDPQRRTIFFCLPDDNSRVEYIKFMYNKLGN